MSYWDDFKELVAPISARSASDVGTLLFTALKESPRFGPMLTQLKKELAGTKQYFKDGDALCAKFKSKHRWTLEELVGAATSIIKFQDHMRKGSVDNVVSLLQAKVQAIASQALEGACHIKVCGGNAENLSASPETIDDRMDFFMKLKAAQWPDHGSVENARKACLPMGAMMKLQKVVLEYISSLANWNADAFASDKLLDDLKMNCARLSRYGAEISEEDRSRYVQACKRSVASQGFRGDKPDRLADRSLGGDFAVGTSVGEGCSIYQ